MKSTVAAGETVDQDGVVDEGPDFQHVLSQINDGQLIDDATRELRNVVAACKHLSINQGGIPTAGLTVSIDMRLVDGVFEVFAQVKTKMPKAKRARSLFYEHKGSLTANNPKQLSMELGTRSPSTAAPSAPVRRVD